MPAANAAQALGELQSAQSSALTSDAATKQANDQYGVDGAHQVVTGLRGAIQRTTSLLNNVAPSVYGRTGGSLVTSAQAGRQIQNEQAPIQQDLQKDNTDYGNAEADYQDVTGKAATKAAGTIADQNSRLSFLQGIYQNLYTQEKDAAQAAEAKRQFDLTLAEQQAARAASAAAARASGGGGGRSSGGGGGASPSYSSGGGGGGSTAPAGPSPQQQLMADIHNLIPKDYASRYLPGYTERQITRLQAAYPGLNVANAVYTYRKQLTGT